MGDANASYSKRTNAAGGAAYFVPKIGGEGLTSALNDACPVADASFSEKGPSVEAEKGMLSYLHKVKDGRQVYFVANSADQRVDMDLTVRGHVSLQRWDPLDGSVAAAETSDRMVGGQPCTRVHLLLEPVKAVFFVEAVETGTP